MRADEAERKAKAAQNRAEVAETRGDELVAKLKAAEEKLNTAGMLNMLVYNPILTLD